MTIEQLVLNQVQDGCNSISHIASRAGMTNVQIYNAGRSLIKKGLLEQTEVGINGTFALKNAQPKIVEAEEVKLPEVPASFTVGFDFNRHFDQFVGQMTSVLIGQVEERIKGQMGPLADAISAQVMANVRETSEKLISEMTASMAAVSFNDQAVVGQQPPQTPEPKQARVRLPKICVCNLLPIQMGELQTEFGQTFDIEFWNGNTGNSTQQLVDYSKNAEMVFWHTKHCSHNAEKVSFRNAGPGKFRRINGSLSQMQNAIRQYYAETTPA